MCYCKRCRVNSQKRDLFLVIYENPKNMISWKLPVFVTWGIEQKKLIFNLKVDILDETGHHDPALSSHHAFCQHIFQTHEKIRARNFNTMWTLASKSLYHFWIKLYWSYLKLFRFFDGANFELCSYKFLFNLRTTYYFQRLFMFHIRKTLQWAFKTFYSLIIQYSLLVSTWLFFVKSSDIHLIFCDNLAGSG